MRPPRQLFHASDRYRARRLADGGRLIAVIGAVLFLLPILTGPHSLAASFLYVFGLWAVLILAAGLMAPGLARHGAGGDGAPPREGGPE